MDTERQKTEQKTGEEIINPLEESTTASSNVNECDGNDKNKSQNEEILKNNGTVGGENKATLDENRTKVNDNNDTDTGTKEIIQGKVCGTCVCSSERKEENVTNIDDEEYDLKNEPQLKDNEAVIVDLKEEDNATSPDIRKIDEEINLSGSEMNNNNEKITEKISDTNMFEDEKNKEKKIEHIRKNFDTEGKTKGDRFFETELMYSTENHENDMDDTVSEFTGAKNDENDYFEEIENGCKDDELLILKEVYSSFQS